MVGEEDCSPAAYTSVYFFAVDFEMLKHSHIEKIHCLVDYASEYTNICLQISGEPSIQCQANSTNMLRGL